MQAVPEVLTVEEVSYIVSDLGVPVERTSVGLSLRAIPVEGVIPPRRRGEAWQVPRERLFAVAVVCLYRRKQRSPDRAMWPMGRCLEDAARRMLSRPGFAHLVPDDVKEHVEELDRQRAREARRRQREALEAERQRQRELAERHERERREERELHERIERERERQDHERVMDGCYSVCFRQGYKAIGAPKGANWPELPEAVQLRRDFPHDRPLWWLPPPGLYEAVKADLPKQVLFGYVEPDWSRWVPPYRPGAPWPWRRPEPDEVDGDAVSR